MLVEHTKGESVMYTHRTLRVFFVCAAALLVSACQTVEPEEPSVAYDGAALYQGHCATCHGMEGAGDGPMAKLLIQSVPDLRTLDMSNKLALIEVIDGRGMRAAHGTVDMPVWGWAFREVEQSENEVQARLNALAEYLQSLQN